MITKDELHRKLRIRDIAESIEWQKANHELLACVEDALLSDHHARFVWAVVPYSAAWAINRILMDAGFDDSDTVWSKFSDFQHLMRIRVRYQGTYRFSRPDTEPCVVFLDGRWQVVHELIGDLNKTIVRALIPPKPPELPNGSLSIVPASSAGSVSIVASQIAPKPQSWFQRKLTKRR